MRFSPLIDQLVEALRCLPGVGPKSAQRMVFHLLERERSAGQHLGTILQKAMIDIKHCHSCRTFCETELCEVCSSQRRDPSLLCIVESPADVLAIEQTGGYRGYYFVLMGHLSPLDGIGPEDIGMEELQQKLRMPELKEVILATNPTVEGEATAHYISQLVSNHEHIVSSRIAHGVPIGGELEYVDGSTLAHALSGRKLVEA